MNIKSHIAKIRSKIEATEIRKENHNKFVDDFIRSAGKGFITLAAGVALSSEIDANAIEAYNQDVKSDNIENVKINESLSCPVLNRVYEITYESCNRKHDVSQFVGHKNKAAYYSQYSHIVCETFNLNDKEAYKIGNGGVDDFDYALSEFKASLTKHKYTGKMPKTLDDVKKILESEISGLKEKQQEKIKASAEGLGLSNALQIKKVVDDINKENTSDDVVNHEHIHAKNAPIIKKALLPSSLVAPHHLLLLNIADELEAQLNGKTSAEDIVNAVNQIKRTNTTNYAQNWQDSVEAYETEIRTYYPQNLDITEDGKIVDNFSQKNYENLLKEMIPDDNLRNLIKVGIMELQKLKPYEDGYHQPVSAYDYLKARHRDFLKGLDVEHVKFEKENPYTDNYALQMQEKRKSNIVSEAGEKHYANLVDVSKDYTLDQSGRVKKQENGNMQANSTLYVAAFDYNQR